MVELDALIGTSANNLREALLEAREPGAKFHVLEQFLVQRAMRSLRPNAMVAHALREFQRCDEPLEIRRVTDSLGVSHKHFIHVFQNENGLTPKRYCRIRRFQHALSAVNRRRQIDWVEIACAAGYFDQAHFVHDFKAFSGLTPSDYVSQRSADQNFVPLDR